MLLGDALPRSASGPPLQSLLAHCVSYEELKIDIDCNLPQAISPQGRRMNAFHDTSPACLARDQSHERLTLDQSRPWAVVVSFSEDHKANCDDRLAPRVGVERNAEVVVPHFHALPDFVVGTKRVATLQLRLARRLATSYPVRIVGAPVPMPRLDEAMMWHPRFEQDPAHVWLRALLKRVAAAMPAETAPDVDRQRSASTVRRGSFGRRRV